MKLQIFIESVSKWSGGGSGMMKVKNMGDYVSNWSFKLETLGYTIGNLYVFNYKNGVVSNKDWNGKLNKGQELESGFTYSGELKSYEFTTDGSPIVPEEPKPEEPKPEEPKPEEPKPEEPIPQVPVEGWKNIPYFYPSNPNGPYWNSECWHNGIAREVKSSGRDPHDPTGLSQKRGSGEYMVDGNGILMMGGSQPRIYINGDINGDNVSEKSFFKNTETTVYYKRTGTDGKDWGGCVIGCRSSPNGHSSPSTNYETTTTMYGRLRHDGKIDFEKELTHSPTSSMMNGKSGKETYFDGKLPSDKWIGLKYIIYNLDDKQVKLELYIDEVSNGEEDKFDISNWKKIGEQIDNGKNWEAPIISAYKGKIDPYKAILKGGGVTFIRNTGADKAEYKYFSVREIVPPGEEVKPEEPKPEEPKPEEPKPESELCAYLYNRDGSEYKIASNGKLRFVLKE